MSRKTNGSPYLGKEVKLDFDSIQAQMSFLEGKVLTVLEASILDDRQLKAVKDLVKSTFREQISWIGQLCYPEVGFVSTDELEASGVDVGKLEKEAEELKD